jgi:hypothetical protein
MPGFIQKLKDRYQKFELGLDKVERNLERMKSDAAEREHIERLKARHDHKEADGAVADFKDTVSDLKSALSPLKKK